MPPLSSNDRRTLLALARRVIIEAVVHRCVPDFPPGAGRLADPGGAFVTLYCGGRLQGCVGRVDRGNALTETVAQCAISAALHDQRFSPLAARHIDDLRIEISVLSELVQTSAQAIEVGTHGLLVICGARHGVLLPQVATEHGWSAERLLEEGCRKAGLEPGAWRDPQTSLFAFTAEVFGEARSQSY
jgi:AmmeMemoRadiSam system protein A